MSFTNLTQIPVHLALWLANDDYDYSDNPYQISATTLLKSPRYIIGSLRKQFPHIFEVPTEKLSYVSNQLIQQANQPKDLSERISSCIGTAIHNAVEEVWLNPVKRAKALKELGYPEQYIASLKVNPSDLNQGSIFTEMRSTRDLDGFTISGKFDFTEYGQLQDIKTTKTYTWVSGCNDQKYIQQGSIYRWLNPEVIKSDTIAINFIFTNWARGKEYDQDYPKSQIVQRHYQLMSVEDTEAFIRNKLELIKNHWNSPLENIPCCTVQELYSSPPTFKYYAKGLEFSTRATKIFGSLAEASAHRAKMGHRGDIIEYRGTPFTCPFCLAEQLEETGMVNHTKVESLF